MKIITRTVLILSIVSLLADIASEMLYPVMPLYLQNVGFTVFWIGLLEGVVNFTAGISKGYFGKRSDEKGLRLPFVKLGYLLSAVSKSLMVTIAHPVWIFFTRMMDRLGKGVRTAARDAMLSDEATPATKARVFGFHRAMDTTGAAIGPVLALIFLFFYPHHYTTLFYLAFIPGLISVACIYLVKEVRRPSNTLPRGNFFSFFKYWRIANPAFRKISTALLLVALFNSSDVFLLLVTHEAIGDRILKIGNLQFNADTLTIAAYIFYNLVYAATSYPLGVWADRMGFRKIILFGFACFAIVYGCFAFSPPLWMIFVLFTVYGCYAAATEGIVKAWITNLADPGHTATAIGFYTSCESCCSFFASLIAGFLWSSFGPAATFGSSAIIAIAVCCYLLVTPIRDRLVVEPS